MDVRIGTRVDRIDLVEEVVHTAGVAHGFSRLLLATGATPRTLPFESDEGISVGYLRSLEDSRMLRERLVPGARLLIVGGGWIGMEVAATARQAGVEVVLVEPAKQPLLRALGPELGHWLAEAHRRHGVDLRTSTSLDALSEGRAFLTDGSELETDTVLIGVGVIPDDALAKAAGLDLDNGILVDAGLRTSHPAVFSAGDVANHAHTLLNKRVRVEHWQNAVSQGKSAAHALLGEPVAYDEVPSFFSDQYDLGMEYFGYPGAAGFDSVRIERGDKRDVLTAEWLRGDTLVAAMHINDWDLSAELAERVRLGR